MSLLSYPLHVQASLLVSQQRIKSLQSQHAAKQEAVTTLEVRLVVRALRVMRCVCVAEGVGR